jgi:hypothetical protein
MRTTVLGIALAGLLASRLLSAAPREERAELHLSLLGAGGKPLDFCPQEWSSLAIVDDKERELWKADPLSLPDRETVDIDLSKPPRR